MTVSVAAAAAALMTNAGVTSANSLPLDQLAAIGAVEREVYIPVGDEATAIATGVGKAILRLPYAFTVNAVYASLGTASSSGLVTVDVNEAGTSILSTKLTIDQSELTSTTAAAAAVISDTKIAANAEISVDIDGAGTGAKGLKVWLVGTKTS